MGFNPRLAPYSLNQTFTVWLGTATTIQTYNVDLFRFPFAGQLLNAYANAAQIVPAGGTVPAAVEATTNTAMFEVSLWKATDGDTTATYATGARAAIRTGAMNSSTGGGINWRLAATSGVPGLYALTNKSAARRKFAADDRLLAHVGVQGATNANRTYEVRVQANYVIGYES